MNRIILKGPSSLLKPTITQVLAEYQLLESQKSGQISTGKNSVKRRNRPQVFLYFNQDGSTAIEGEISFRIMDRKTTTITDAEIKSLASIIRQKFATGGGFTWSKGKVMYSYTDWELGYQLQLLCSSEGEARRIIEQILDIRKFSPEWEYMNIIQNANPAKAFPQNPGRETILGQSVKLAQIRPSVTVRFQYAYLVLDGLSEPIYLVDRSNKFLKVVERV
ncbi:MULTISPECIES: hypothetical protein [Cyanophyceae]|uniref:hypothetical protein n=1 Tax=Cyanophyceae TaxID=3028117 RepID=UPI00168526A2|nr:hypothetical protein [Trichocoleus sp. FACHB-40]MBD2001917.1 hypothetical protein [Trichocoleus sp. FACHB-40]